MKIRALTAVDDGKKYYPPGTEWDCRKKDAEALIAAGAAVAVPEPENGVRAQHAVPPQEPAAVPTQNPENGVEARHAVPVRENRQES